MRWCHQRCRWARVFCRPWPCSPTGAQTICGLVSGVRSIRNLCHHVSRAHAYQFLQRIFTAYLYCPIADDVQDPCWSVQIQVFSCDYGQISLRFHHFLPKKAWVCVCAPCIHDSLCVSVHSFRGKHTDADPDIQDVHSYSVRHSLHTAHWMEMETLHLRTFTSYIIYCGLVLFALNIIATFFRFFVVTVVSLSQFKVAAKVFA